MYEKSTYHERDKYIGDWALGEHIEQTYEITPKV